MESANYSQEYGAKLDQKSGQYERPDKDHIETLKKQKVMKSKFIITILPFNCRLYLFFESFYINRILVKITWNYGGRKVYIIGSFTNWEFMIKMHKSGAGHTPIFEISMVIFAILMNP